MASILRSTFRGLTALALVAAPLASAGAAKLSQVRVGTHEDHTRIVLELDEAAAYRLAPPGSGQQLQIELDAESGARHVSSRSPLVKAVRVQPRQRGATISVDLTQPGVEVSEMVLANPPRIVFDLKPAGSTAATAAAPAPQAEPVAPAPAPGRLAADGRPVGAEAKGAAPSLSDPVPSDVAATKPAARFEAPKVEPAPAAAPAAAPIAKAEPAPSASAGSAAKGADATTAEAKPAEAESGPADAKAEDAPAAQTEPAGEATADAVAQAEAEAESAAPAAPARPAEVVVRKPSPPAAERPAPAEASWSEWLTSPTGYAAIGGVLLALVVLAVRRRRRDEDDDPLYSVMSAEDAGGDDEDMRAQQHDEAAWSSSEEEAAEEPVPAYGATARFDADEPVASDGSQQLGLARVQEDTEASGAADADPDALFDGPGAPLVATAAAASLADASDASFGGDGSRIAAELESRVKDLERRIEQLAEARERLERQVAAQTEELRVQRAAIARTQRVVRSLTKGEDLATEPVPRAPQA